MTALAAASPELLSLAGADVPLRRVTAREWHGPCPLCGGRDRFRVEAGQEGERFACRRCGAAGDAAGYVHRVRGMAWPEAFAALGQERERAARPAPTVHRARPASEPSAEWRKRAAHVVDACQAALWTPAGERAREWLHRRGLRDETLRTWRIGYCAPERLLRIAGEMRPGREVGGLRVPAGITIPWLVAGAVRFVNVRRPVHAGEKPKFLAVAGGQRLLFGADTLRVHRVAFLVEGELDAMLLAQEAGDLAGVATLGSSTDGVDARAVWHLLHLRHILSAYDADEAGRAGAERLARQFPCVRIVPPPVGPGGKDISDAFAQGADLRAWVEKLLAELAEADAGEAAPDRALEHDAARLFPGAHQVAEAAVEGGKGVESSVALPAEPGGLRAPHTGNDQTYKKSEAHTENSENSGNGVVAAFDARIESTENAENSRSGSARGRLLESIPAGSGAEAPEGAENTPEVGFRGVFSQGNAAELARRTEAFRAQVDAGRGPLPLLCLPDAPARDGVAACLSCGEPATDRYGTRCDACAAAAWIALGLEPPAPGPDLPRVEGSVYHLAPEYAGSGPHHAAGLVPWLHAETAP